MTPDYVSKADTDSHIARSKGYKAKDTILAWLRAVSPYRVLSISTDLDLDEHMFLTTWLAANDTAPNLVILTKVIQLRACFRFYK